MRKRSHYRGYSGIDKSGEHLAVSLIHITYETIVDAVLQRTFMGMEHIHVSTCQAKGIDSRSLQSCHHVLVHQTAIHHRNHLKHIGISDASAVDHLSLYTK